MKNETKRDVFDQALSDWRDFVFDVGFQGEELHGYCEFDAILSKYRKDYRTALPDNMPIIPEAVGEWIKDAKARYYDLLDAMTKWTLDQPVFDWIHDNSDTFATAFLLGTWRVEETEEIVKLEVTDYGE